MCSPLDLLPVDVHATTATDWATEHSSQCSAVGHWSTPRDEQNRSSTHQLVRDIDERDDVLRSVRNRSEARDEARVSPRRRPWPSREPIGQFDVDDERMAPIVLSTDLIEDDQLSFEATEDEVADED